jgi:hypothetical protein
LAANCSAKQGHPGGEGALGGGGGEGVCVWGGGGGCRTACGRSASGARLRMAAQACRAAPSHTHLHHEPRVAADLVPPPGAVEVAAGGLQAVAQVGCVGGHQHQACGRQLPGTRLRAPHKA